MPTAVESDRSIKLDAARAPEARPGDPDPGQLALPPGRAARTCSSSPATPGFNAGVTGGTVGGRVRVRPLRGRPVPAPEAPLHLVHRRRPGRRRRAAATGARSRARTGTSPGGAGFGLGDVEHLPEHGRDQGVAGACSGSACSRPAARTSATTPDGSLTNQSLRYLPEHAKSLRKRSRSWSPPSARTTRRWPRRASTSTQPHRFFYFERALAVHEQARRGAGDRAQPRLPDRARPSSRSTGTRAAGASLEKVARAAQALPVRLRRLRRTSARWGGTAYDWSNATHVNRANMRRLLALHRRPLRRRAALGRRRCCSTATSSCSASCPACSSAGGSCARKPLRLAFLTGASWFFYAWWDWRYLPVLIGATSVDYVAGLWIAEHGRRAAAAAAARRVADDEHRDPRLLQVRGLLPRHAERDRQRPRPAARHARRCTSSCRSGSPSTRSTRCRTRSTSSGGGSSRPGTSSSTRPSSRCSRT